MLAHTKSLIVVTAVSELLVGVLLLITPSATAKLLLGTGLGSPESVLVGRMAGAALLSISLICWLQRNHHRSPQGIGLIAGLLLYNTAAVALLLYAAVGEKMDGIGIWPTIVLHAALSIWCAASLRAPAAAVRTSA